MKTMVFETVPRPPKKGNKPPSKKGTYLYMVVDGIVQPGTYMVTEAYVVNGEVQPS